MPSDTTVHRDVAFTRRPDRESPLALDVYEPARDRGARPAVVVYHGGAWLEGEKGQLEALARGLAARGYVCLDANYRLSGEATFPAQARDAAAAVRFARSGADEYGIDPDRIAATGHSAGAHLAALVAAADGAFDPADAAVDSSLAAAAPISGIYDLRDDAAVSEVERRFLGGDPADVPDRYRRASPAAHVDERTPPVLLLHGAEDDVLPASNARSFAATLRAAGGPVELGIVPGGDHGIVADTHWRDRGIATVADFLDRRL